MQVAQKSNEAKYQELKVLDAAIAERKKYHREQEALITDLIESGNTLLMGLNHDILLAKQELRSIKTDIRTAAQDKVLLNEDLDNIRGEIQLTVVSTTFVGFTPAFG
jgi:hypothetical protein